MHHDTGAENGISPRQILSLKRPPLTLAASRHFKLDAYDLTESDILDLWGNLVEAMALCSRLGRGRLTQARPLAQIADLVPPMSKTAIHSLSDRDAADLVSRLRQVADGMREKEAVGTN